MPSFLLYARKSSESDDAQVLSISGQIETLLRFAAERGIQVARVLSESASAKAPGRPVFSSILRLLAEGQAEGILTWKLDRLARNPVDGGAIIWALDQGQLQHLVTPGRIYQNTPADKFWMQLEFGMAKKYIDDLSEDVRRGRRRKLEDGGLPGRAPVGYRNDRLRRTVIPDPIRFPLVRKIWELALRGIPVPEILRTVNQDWGFRTAGSGYASDRPLSRSALYHLLASPFYYGVVTSKGESFAGRHTPMITREEFDQVQVLLRRRTPIAKHAFPYTRLITCGECGASVTAEHTVNRYGTRYTYYHCTKRLRRASCTQRSIRAEALEAQLLAFTRTLFLPSALQRWAVAAVHARRQDRCLETIAQEATAESLRATERQLERLMDLYLQGLIDEHSYRTKKASLEQDRARFVEQEHTTTPVTVSVPPSLATTPVSALLSRRLSSVSPTIKRTLFCLVGTYLLRDQRLHSTALAPFRTTGIGFERLTPAGDSSWTE